MRFIGLFILFIVLAGCEKVFFKDEPTAASDVCFDIFWNDFDRYYSQFEIRQINWDSVYSVYRPKIGPTTTKTQLLYIFDDIIQLLKDGHVNLFSPFRILAYNDLFPENYYGGWFPNLSQYISFSLIQNSAIECGAFYSANIAYIRVNTFLSDEFAEDDSRFNIIDEIIRQYIDKDGMIVDVRGNGGGNGANAETIASRFADNKYLYLKQRSKTGPGKDDFSEWVNYYIEKGGELQFTKPVVVLMSRHTYSAAEIFVSAMSVFPHVTLVGDTTAGGIGNPVYRELPNGWSYRLSTSIGAMADGYIIEGKGIVPEVAIVTTDSITRYSRDIMLEKAMEVILNSN